MRTRHFLTTTIHRWEQGAMWGVGTVVVLLLIVIILQFWMLFREPPMTKVEYSQAVRYQLKELLTKDPDVLKVLSQGGSETLDPRVEQFMKDVGDINAARETLSGLVTKVEEQLTRIEECACPKKRVAAPKAPVKPVARPARPAPKAPPKVPVETRTFVPLLPNERIVAPLPALPSREMPLGTKPRIECPPGRPSTAVTTGGEVCR